ncbi:two-component system, NarL family, response regulator DesR [Nonomuraea maritima]|uniref:Two-component system, NarL family, response regulator DesR n=1 Tax=Nonomuraea maritima TaxID=683260 RepID=A0A1G9HL44_9ACTN|nr:response regulator transcription factor [Nonomuraea maritima]SDL13496.1 two-component system, NarL family, response regulator DesR [Nonomuraea maritima]
MIRVLLAEDHGVVRGALVALLNLTGDITVVAETGRGDRVLAEALSSRPHVAVIDIEMPRLDGIAATERLVSAVPECRVLILTGLAQTGLLRQALEAGATGFLMKDAPTERLAESIRRVADGEQVVDGSLAFAAMRAPASPLTERETDVLVAIGSGATTGEIADKLHLSVATVRNYISSVLTKTGARNRTDAVRIASESGWI